MHAELDTYHRLLMSRTYKSADLQGLLSGLLCFNGSNNYEAFASYSKGWKAFSN